MRNFLLWIDPWTHNTECSQIQKAPAFSFTHLFSFSAVLVLLADWLPLGLFLYPRSIEDGPTHTVLSVYKSPIQLRDELRAAGLRAFPDFRDTISDWSSLGHVPSLSPIKCERRVGRMPQHGGQRIPPGEGTGVRGRAGLTCQRLLH